MVINGLSGVITWRADTAGDYDIVVRATDERDEFAEQSYRLTIIVNDPPLVSSSPVNFARINREYRYQIQAVDPEGQTLAYTLLSRPTDMTLSDAGLLLWTPTEEILSPISMRISDGVNSVIQSWDVLVLSADDELTFNISVSDTFVNEGDSVTIDFFPFNVIEPYTISATLDGQAITVENNQAVVTVSAIGPHFIEATLTDPYDTLTATASFNVRDPADTEAPQITVLAPIANSVITAPTDIVATIQDANLASWRVRAGRSTVPVEDLPIIAQGNIVVDNQVIGRFDPTLLENGLYRLVVEATDQSGQSSGMATNLLVEGDVKICNFSFTVEDLKVPLAGLPIRVTRTYDSRRRLDSQP